MRTTSFFAFLIIGFALMLLAPANTPGQMGGRKGGGMTMDAGALFDRMANGRPSIPINEMRFGRPQMEKYAKDKGITNGLITRQQYIEFQDQLRASMAAGGGGRWQFPPQGGGMNPFSPGGGGPGSGVTIIQQAPSGNPDVINQLADADFKRRDANGDGKLNQEEMPPPLRFGLAKWDKNGDGLIDMYEYREYFAARLVGNVGGGDDNSTRGIASIIIEEEELDRKPVVFRGGGKMPPGLPPWFKQLDTDGDGQVALFEWRKGGKDLDEFKQWDLNDDGFITPEEAVKHMAVLAKNGPASAPSIANAMSNPNGAPPRMNFNDFIKRKAKN